VDGATLLAVLRKEGVPELRIEPPLAPARDAGRLLQARKQIVELMPPNKPFVLVDEEHLRSVLRDPQALPFLEKDGAYWGPPPDDVTAIRELERLRRAGARAVVFIWTTFWWLNHYARFERHLRSHYRCLRENECVVAFELSKRH
jgi:hypothetical protein